VKHVYGLNNGIKTEEIMQLRVAYEPAKRPRDLLFIGRMTAKAELGLLLEALAHPDCGQTTLDVIGDGPTLGKLQCRAHELGVADRIAWHGGTINEAHIAKIANRCKLFVYPGSVGLSLIHGLAYGLPAIVHDDRWTQMPEIAALEPDKNGMTFKKGSAADLAGKISGLVLTGAELERMSAAAVATTNDSFNTRDMAERFCTAIKDVQAPTKAIHPKPFSGLR
jgi:glycosyltransferase involved in cell wall biosynthesis